MHKATTIFQHQAAPPYGQELLYPVVLSNGSVVNMQFYNSNGQFVNQSSRTYSTHPTRTTFTPTPTQMIQDPSSPMRLENSPGPLPIQKHPNANDKNFNKYGGNSLTSSIGSIPTAFTNPTSTNEGTDLASIASTNLPAQSNGLATKFAKPEYMAPLEKERRRMTYQAAIRKHITYKVSSSKFFLWKLID